MKRQTKQENKHAWLAISILVVFILVIVSVSTPKSLVLDILSFSLAGLEVGFLIIVSLNAIAKKSSHAEHIALLAINLLVLFLISFILFTPSIPLIPKLFSGIIAGFLIFFVVNFFQRGILNGRA